MRRLFLAATFGMIAAGSASAQSSAYSMAITGRVGSAWMMEPVTISSNSGASLRRMDSQSVVVEIAAASRSSQPSVVQFTIAIRTNANQFHIRAEQVGCAQAPSISVGMPSASGSGSLVNPAAISSFSGSDAVSLEAPMYIAAGPRISIGGRFTSTENALLVPFSVKVADGSACSVRISISE